MMAPSQSQATMIPKSFSPAKNDTTKKQMMGVAKAKIKLPVSGMTVIPASARAHNSSSK